MTQERAQEYHNSIATFLGTLAVGAPAMTGYVLDRSLGGYGITGGLAGAAIGAAVGDMVDKSIIGGWRIATTLGGLVGSVAGYALDRASGGSGVGGAFGGTLITSALLGVQYVSGRWPFTEIKEKEFQFTQWFNGEPGPVLIGSGTRLFLSPFIKKVGGAEGNIERVAARSDEEQMPMIKFRTADGLEGKMDGQYIYRIADQSDAYKYFWGLNAPRERAIGNLVASEIQNEIGTIFSEAPVNEDPRNVGVPLTYVYRVINRINGFSESNPQGPPNPNSFYAKRGVFIESIQLSQPDYDDRSQDILANPVRAQKEAEALFIKARAEGEEATIQAQATLDSLKRYEVAAEQIIMQGSKLSKGDIILELQRRDNLQQMSGKGGNVVEINLNR